MSDYEKAVQIVKHRNYTKENKKLLMSLVLLMFPCELILEELQCKISLNLKNQLVIEPMNFFDTINNL